MKDLHMLCTNYNEKKFLNLFETYVTNRDWEQYIRHLITETDFFTAPASTRHHGAYEGGLLEHSLHVFENMMFLTQHKYAGLSPEKFESIIICSLLHDVCKTGVYHKGKKWEKQDGRWVEVETYIFEDPFPAGHGEKSVMKILPYMRLTAEEQLAIRWHMGRFDSSADTYNGLQLLGMAQKQYTLVTALHLADMMATWFDERDDG